MIKSYTYHHVSETYLTRKCGLYWYRFECNIVVICDGKIFYTWPSPEGGSQMDYIRQFPPPPTMFFGNNFLWSICYLLIFSVSQRRDLKTHFKYLHEYLLTVQNFSCFIWKKRFTPRQKALKVHWRCWPPPFPGLWWGSVFFE